MVFWHILLVPLTTQSTFQFEVDPAKKKPKKPAPGPPKPEPPPKKPNPKVKSVANMSLGGGRSRSLDRAVDAVSFFERLSHFVALRNADF